MMQWSIRLGAQKPEDLQKTEKRIWKAILDIVNQPSNYLSILKDLASAFPSTYIQELERQSESVIDWFNTERPSIPLSEDPNVHLTQSGTSALSRPCGESNEEEEMDSGGKPGEDRAQVSRGGGKGYLEIDKGKSTEADKDAGGEPGEDRANSDGGKGFGDEMDEEEGGGANKDAGRKDLEMDKGKSREADKDAGREPGEDRANSGGGKGTGDEMDEEEDGDVGAEEGNGNDEIDAGREPGEDLADSGGGKGTGDEMELGEDRDAGAEEGNGNDDMDVDEVSKDEAQRRSSRPRNNEPIEPSKILSTGPFKKRRGCNSRPAVADKATSPQKKVTLKEGLEILIVRTTHVIRFHFYLA